MGFNSGFKGLNQQLLWFGHKTATWLRKSKK